MTASSVDTAELPRVRRWDSATAAPAPVIDRAAPVVGSGPLVIDPPVPVLELPRAVAVAPAPVPVPGRVELRAERRQARRQRRYFALLGLSVLVAALAVTVVVLDVIR